MLAIARSATIALVLGFCAAPSAAAQAIVACGASPPPVGATVHGPVLQVIDARTVCVALGPLPEQWLQLKLKTPTATGKGATQGLFAQTVTSKVIASRPDGVRAACQTVQPQTLGTVESAQLPF